MITATTHNSYPAPNSKPSVAKKWLQRRLWKPASRQVLQTEGDGGLKRKLSLKRPRTAPSSETTTSKETLPVPQIPINMDMPSPRLALCPPPRPPRPDSGVIRDVNAWLDASMSMPSPPLMDGISYWRSASDVPSTTSSDVQYAIPIVREPGLGRPPTPSSQQVKSFCRRAKKVQVRMPSLLRSTSQHNVARKETNRRSDSMPLLGIPYGQTQQAAPPGMLTRSRSLYPRMRTLVSETSNEAQRLLSAGQDSVELVSVRGMPTSTAYSRAETHGEQRTKALPRQTTKSRESTRPWTAGAPARREDSMGELSDAPTYFSGRPPPSYRSRTASMATKSSFGCVDGMSPAQRQISQQRAAMKTRGVRGMVRVLQRRFMQQE
jgi:hypothetical protein